MKNTRLQEKKASIDENVKNDGAILNIPLLGDLIKNAFCPRIFVEDNTFEDWKNLVSSVDRRNKSQIKCNH